MSLSGAEISSCGTYRYRLWRQWDAGSSVAFVMLNPSTADASLDDQTIRKCVGYAKRWGFGRLEVVNLYGYRATDPKALLSVADPVGPSNDVWIRHVCERAGKVIVAWGADKAAKKRGPTVAEMLTMNLYALKEGPRGDPYHPLYQKNDLEPQRWPR